MKKAIWILLLSAMPLSVLSQKISSMEQWKPLLDKKELADYFSGIFNSMGFIVEETGEQFTVHHRGDHFTLSDGIINDSVDYIVPLKLENIQNMVKHGADSKIDETESFKIMSVLFTPLTESSLQDPMMSNPLMVKLSKKDNVIHANLVSPDKKDTISHTLIFLNKEWMVIPGHHGTPKRIFNLEQEDAVEFQQNIFKAFETNTSKGWKEFRKWYIPWRDQVSKRV